MRRFNSILILSSALIMASCGQQTNNQQTAAVVVEEAPKVTVTKVYAENVSQLSTYPTTVEAEIINNITPQSASRINKIFVEIGDHVTAGQTLATMDAINLEKLTRLRSIKENLFKLIGKHYFDKPNIRYSHSSQLR